MKVFVGGDAKPATIQHVSMNQCTVEYDDDLAPGTLLCKIYLNSYCAALSHACVTSGTSSLSLLSQM